MLAYLWAGTRREEMEVGDWQNGRRAMIDRSGNQTLQYQTAKGWVSGRGWMPDPKNRLVKQRVDTTMTAARGRLFVCRFTNPSADHRPFSQETRPPGPKSEQGMQVPYGSKTPDIPSPIFVHLNGGPPGPYCCKRYQAREEGAALFVSRPDAAHTHPTQALPKAAWLAMAVARPPNFGGMQQNWEYQTP